MRLSASQLLHAALGAPRFERAERCVDIPSSQCWVCGGTTTRGLPREDWMGANFVGQNKVRAWASTIVCEACMCVTSWTTPAVMPVPGAAEIHAANSVKRAEARAAKVAAGGKAGTERDLMWRLFSVLYDDGQVLALNKASKPQILAWLRAPKRGAWFSAIADSGQKHVVPWCPVNLPGRSARVLFEERELSLPTGAGWSLVDDVSALLTAGATKDEITSGDYTPRSWAMCGEGVERFESAWSRERASAWWELALWLAQRDEAKVAERVEAKKKEPRNAGRKAAKGDRGSDGVNASGREVRVPGSGGKRNRPLESPGNQDAERGAADGDRRGVDDPPASNVAARSADGSQLALF